MKDILPFAMIDPMSNGILFPVVNENHRKLCAKASHILEKLEQGEKEGVSALLFQLFNHLERYYITHNTIVKKNYCSACKKQMEAREEILNLVFEACRQFQTGEHDRVIHTLKRLIAFLKKTMYTFHDQ